MQVTQLEWIITLGVTIAVLRPPHELRELLIETHHRAYAGGSRSVTAGRSFPRM